MNKPFNHTCVRCGHNWRSEKEKPRACANYKCRVNAWNRPAREIKYRINVDAPIGGNLIFAPFTMYKAYEPRPYDPNEFPDMPHFPDNGMLPDADRARITQATIERKLKKMGISFRVAVLPNGVMYVRTAS